MKPGFDWQAEDNFYSHENPRRLRDKGRSRLPRWAAVIIVVVLVIASGWLIMRQLRQYVAETSSSIEVEIGDTLELLVQAQESRDLELISSFISGRDVEWARNQLLLMETAGLTDRSQFGLIQLETAAQGSANVTVSANLNEAVYEKTFFYQLEGSRSEDDRIELTQVLLFRKGSDRWLLSPPDAGFWGREVRKGGRFITGVYPDRDRDLGQRLVADLEGTLVSTCSTLFGSCPDNLKVTIHFSTDPNLLNQSVRTAVDSGGVGLVVQLPTPTILGLPVNDASYRAIYRTYATLLVRRLLESGTDTPCCVKPTFNIALIDEQLHRLGLAAPWKGADLNELVDLEDVANLWIRDGNQEPLSGSEREMIRIFTNELVKDLPSHRLNQIRVDLGQTKEFWQWLSQADSAEVYRDR